MRQQEKMNLPATILTKTSPFEGVLVKPLTTCHKHGEIYDLALVRKEFDRRKHDDYFYYRCLACRSRQAARNKKLKRATKNRIKDAIFARVQELTGNNPAVTKVQKKVVNMFLSINRSSKK